VFAFGIGTSVNRFLLDRMAGEGRGAVEYVTLANSADAAARRFHERVRNPLLTDIKLEWTGSPVKDLYPERVPDLFSAEPVVVCGRYSRGGTALLRLSGRSGDGAFERNLRIPLPEAEPEHDVLAKLWARRRIDALMAQDYSGMQHGRPRADIEESIVALGLEHRLMTQFTSFVAVEERVVTEGGKTRKVQVPVEMPEGVRYEGVFGAAAVGGVVGGVAGGIVASLPGGNSSLSAPLPPPPSADAPVRIGGQVQEAKLIRRVEPVIPELARKAAISAGVWLEVNVDAAGNVTGARVLRGHPLLDDAAIAAVKQWKYSPTLLNGSPVPVVVTVTFPFKAAVQARLDPAIALLIARALSGAAPAAGEFNFVRDGKAEVELTVDASSLRLREQLVALGFEIVSWPHGSATVVGRIPVQKAAALLDLDAVRFIAPR
jgi:TonB family protein